MTAGENVCGSEGGGCLDSAEQEDFVGRGDEEDAMRGTSTSVRF